MMQDFWGWKDPANKSGVQLSHSGQLQVLPPSKSVFDFLLENTLPLLQIVFVRLLIKTDHAFLGTISVQSDPLSWELELQELKWLGLTCPVVLPRRQCLLVSLTWLP